MLMLVLLLRLMEVLFLMLIFLILLRDYILLMIVLVQLLGILLLLLQAPAGADFAAGARSLVDT